jgi:hypothetical protein
MRILDQLRTRFICGWLRPTSWDLLSKLLELFALAKFVTSMIDETISAIDTYLTPELIADTVRALCPSCRDFGMNNATAGVSILSVTIFFAYCVALSRYCMELLRPQPRYPHKRGNTSVHKFWDSLTSFYRF